MPRFRPLTLSVFILGLWALPTGGSTAQQADEGTHGPNVTPTS